MKKIIVACGSGVATSQTVASKISRILADKKVQASVEAVDIKSLSHHIKTCDIYVSITNPNETYDVPTLNGIAFLTGIGIDAEVDKLMAALEK